MPEWKDAPDAPGLWLLCHCPDDPGQRWYEHRHLFSAQLPHATKVYACCKWYGPIAPPEMPEVNNG